MKPCFRQNRIAELLPNLQDAELDSMLELVEALALKNKMDANTRVCKEGPRRTLELVSSHPL